MRHRLAAERILRRRGWPILSLKSDGAPLIIEKSPSIYLVSGSTSAGQQV